MANEFRGQIKGAHEAYNYVMAGNSTVTFVSAKTGKRYTFKVKAPQDKGAESNIRFVQLLNGPDNEGDFMYMGIIKDGKTFTLTKNSKVTKEAESYKAFSYVWSLLVNEAPLDHVEIWHEGRCGRCGRKLTVPESIESGYGPDCLSKIAC